MISLKGACQSPVLITLSNSPETVLPGGHFTLFFDVNSKSSFSDPPDAQIVLPEKWNLLSSRKPEKILGQTTLRYFFLVGTPLDCEAGNFPVDFKIVMPGREPVVSNVFVKVQEVSKIEIFTLSKPEFVKEGDELRVEFLIQNSGNRKEVLSVKTGRGKIENYTDSITLAANEKTTVTVSQSIPITDNNAWQISSDLSAHLKGGGPPVYEVVSIPVFSSTIKKIDRYFRFPVEIGGGYLSYRYGERKMSAFQYAAEGRGYIDQKEKHHLDFIIRGPNQLSFPAVGSYDQYSLEYRFRKRTFISVGDYVLQVNNLTEVGRFGRGLKFEQHFNKIDYSVFYQKARFYFNQKESAGAKVTFKFNESANLAVSYASKNVIFRREQFWADLAGISNLIRTRSMQLETEISAGKARGKTDYGAFLRMQLSKKYFSFSGNLIYAGKNFFGYYNNSVFLNSSIGINITQKLTLGLTGNYSVLNPSLDISLYSISPKDKSYLAFLTYQPNLKNRFFIYYSIQEREDRQKSPQFHYTENFGNLTYNFTSDKFSLVYQGRYGNSINQLVADNTRKRESFSNQAQPAVRILSGVWLGAYIEHQHTSKFSRTDITENLFFYGGNARINIKRNLLASFMYRNNYAPDQFYERRSFVDVSLVLDLKRHKFTINGNRSFMPTLPGQENNTQFFSIKYALKLNVPLSRKKNIGTLKGQLTGDGFPLDGNLIQLGSHKFLTDSTGKFSFEGIAPDKYFLSITQNASRNDGVVPELKMPMVVNIKADSIKTLNIALTRTGNVIGKVEFVRPGQNGLSSVLDKHPTVLVKLFNNAESFVTELNDKNEFSFKEMKPGNWTIMAFIPGKQDRFVIDDDKKQLDIIVDKTMNILFRVKPNEKRIHFSDRGFDLTIKK